ncbi:hypothetical protein HPB50_027510 [Hyalomma asiaticum]|uniref:Uncharacterized protein n=1 Tax=Hyalomma asiaticum TaxID=266040 RepID=A0ACB7T543_HYAAI|nr:hypothetical protein HPB50_027510 [Hyalomma asiaticum]
MQGTQYVLTGFGDFFERRQVAFVDPLPCSCVCCVCGFASSSTTRLPCGHVLCSLCKGRGGSVCPAVCGKFEEADVTLQTIQMSDLGQLRVSCINRGCDFVGKLTELPGHVLKCVNDEVECNKCGVHVKRNAAFDHHRQCCVGVSTAGTTASLADVVAADQGAVTLREQESGGEHADKHDVPIGTDSSPDDVITPEATPVRVKRTYRGELRMVLCNTSSSTGTVSHEVTPGPYRTVSKPGVFLTLCRLDNIYEKYGELRLKEATSTIIKGCVLGGYTFAFKCTLYRDLEGATANVSFSLYLGTGEWDNSVEWPFGKTVTTILTHPRDRAKDIRLKMFIFKPSEGHIIKKPAPTPSARNKGLHTSHDVSWERIECEGFIHNNALFVNVELE